jgi:uracil-DNA glycosylase
MGAGYETGVPRGYLLPAVPPAWRDAVRDVVAGPGFAALTAFLESEGRAYAVYPPPGDVFRALELTSPDAVRVVLLGQDPYAGRGQAHGLCFSVPPGVKAPPSLRNVCRELESDLGIPAPSCGSLEAWARQGVLLLNTVLTVRAGAPGSHAGRGWESFTDAVIARAAARRAPVVFALWGAHAQRKRALLEGTQHAVVTAAHPSPLSAWRGFLGSRPFSRIDAALAAAGQTPIDWRLPDVERPRETRWERAAARSPPRGGPGRPDPCRRALAQAQLPPGPVPAPPPSPPPSVPGTSMFASMLMSVRSVLPPNAPEKYSTAPTMRMTMMTRMA